MSEQLVRYALSFNPQGGFFRYFFLIQEELQRHLQEAVGDETLKLELRSPGNPHPWYLIVVFHMPEKREFVIGRVAGLLEANGLETLMEDIKFDVPLPAQYLE